MEIVEVGRDGEAFGNVGEIAVLGRRDDLDLAVTPGLLDGFLGPDARIDIAGLLAEEVGGDLVEKGAGAAAQVENLVVVGDGEQLAEELVASAITSSKSFVRCEMESSETPVPLKSRMALAAFSITSSAKMEGPA